MNWKKFFIAFIAAWVFVFLFGGFFHEVLLKDAYAQLPSGLQRSPEDFRSHFGWLVAGQILFVLMFIAIYASGFAGGGVASGIKLGIMLTIMSIGGHALIT